MAALWVDFGRRGRRLLLLLAPRLAREPTHCYHSILLERHVPKIRTRTKTNPWLVLQFNCGVPFQPASFDEVQLNTVKPSWCWWFRHSRLVVSARTQKFFPISVSDSLVCLLFFRPATAHSPCFPFAVYLFLRGNGCNKMQHCFFFFFLSSRHFIT